jgi:hypothetical protein
MTVVLMIELRARAVDARCEIVVLNAVTSEYRQRRKKIGL